MGRRRRESSSRGLKRWILTAVLRFFGISSPAVLLMALLSYMGFKTPVPDSPADSPEAIAARAKKIIEIAETAKTKLKQTLAKLSSDDGESLATAAEKRTTSDADDLMNVTYQELFEDSSPTPSRAPGQAPPSLAPSRVPPTSKASERPPARISDRSDRKKSSGEFPDINATPFR